MTNDFLTDYLASTLRLSVPLAYAAMGGLFSERSGVLNIGLEGMLLTGAFTSAATTFYSGNVVVGIIAALITGGLVGLLHAFLCVTLRVNQLVSGLAINLVAGGLTSFFGRLIFSGSNTQRLQLVPAIKIPILSNISIIGILFEQDILVYLLFLIIALTTYFLFYTNPGLNLRAVGEYPSSADTAGIPVALVRYIAVVVGGCLVGCGGAYLALVQVNYFAEGMSAGRGFIAIASLICGRWHPVGTGFASLLFGATEALQLRIQALGVNIPYQFLTMLPYTVALIALVGGMGKSRPPGALSEPHSGKIQ
ncbi:inner-membrane translocator [Calothrix sp. NIES-4071]|nr:inner-membrane translocator [Calothrix sp. NIES-4071]BAZ63288.1 inner-membrane translocator [Calothrix sp. NIES-4105]